MNSFRIENKYKTELTKLSEVYRFLSNNNAKSLFPKRLIRSIYFDDQIFSIYHESIEGTVPRKKIRVRTYSNNDNFDPKTNFNLEIKINSVEGRFKTVKKKINHLKLLRHGIFDKNYGIIYPVIEVSYYREYFQVFELRVTIDTKINYKIFKKNNSLITDETCVLEVKSNSLKNNNYIDENFYFMKTRFSKYCNGVENLNLV